MRMNILNVRAVLLLLVSSLILEAGYERKTMGKLRMGTLGGSSLRSSGSSTNGKTVLHLDFESDGQTSIDEMKAVLGAEIISDSNLSIHPDGMDGHFTFKGSDPDVGELKIPLPKPVKNGRMRIRWGTEVSYAGLKIVAVGNDTELFDSLLSVSSFIVSGAEFPFKEMIAPKAVHLKGYQNFGELTIEWRGSDSHTVTFRQPDSIENANEILIDKEDVGSFISPGIPDAIVLKSTHSKNSSRTIYLYDLLIEEL